METPESSENHEEVSRRKKKQAVFEDFEEIVPNVIGKSAYLCYTIRCLSRTYFPFFLSSCSLKGDISPDGTSTTLMHNRDKM